MQDLDRNSLIGFALLGILMIAYLNWQSRTNQALVLAEQARQDSLATVQAIRTQDSLLRANQQLVEGLEANPSQAVDTTRLSFVQSQRAERLGLFAPLATGEAADYTIEDSHLKVTLSNQGGKVTRVELKQYEDFRRDPLILF